MYTELLVTIQQIGRNGFRWQTAGASFGWSQLVSAWLRTLVEGCDWAATEKWMSGRNEVNQVYVLKVEYGHWRSSAVPPVMASSVMTLFPNKVICYQHDDSWVQDITEGSSWPFQTFSVACKAVSMWSIPGGFLHVYLSIQFFNFISLLGTVLSFH